MKLIFMIMALFGLTIAFSGCSKISLKPKSLGPFSLIPNRRIFSTTMLNKLSMQRWKRYKKLGRGKILILINKEMKLCGNFYTKHKKRVVRIFSFDGSIKKVMKSYSSRFIFNCTMVSNVKYHSAFLNPGDPIVVWPNKLLF